MKKLNNKGFSLVELIIVIAIMAILVGVVGTQVIPYLESSRKAKDEQILSAWNTAAVSAYSMQAGNLDASSTYTITGNVSGTTMTFSVTASLKNNAKLLAKFRELNNLGGTDAAPTFDMGKMSSKAGQAISKVEISINGGTGAVTTKTTTGSGSFDDITNE